MINWDEWGWLFFFSEALICSDESNECDLVNSVCIWWQTHRRMVRLNVLGSVSQLHIFTLTLLFWFFFFSHQSSIFNFLLLNLYIYSKQYTFYQKRKAVEKSPWLSNWRWQRKHSVKSKLWEANRLIWRLLREPCQILEHVWRTRREPLRLPVFVLCAAGVWNSYRWLRRKGLFRSSKSNISQIVGVAQMEKIQLSKEISDWKLKIEEFKVCKCYCIFLADC